MDIFVISVLIVSHSIVFYGAYKAGVSDACKVYRRFPKDNNDGSGKYD